MNDLGLFVLRIDPLSRLPHFADDQIIAEAAPYQIIEESLRLLAVGGRALQSQAFADGADDQFLLALLFVSFVERVFDGFGREFFAQEVAAQARSAYRLRSQARVGEIRGELLVIQVAQLFESGEDLTDDLFLRPILLHQSRAHLGEAARLVGEQIERPLESLLVGRLRHGGMVKRRPAARQAPRFHYEKPQSHRATETGRQGGFLHVHLALWLCGSVAFHKAHVKFTTSKWACYIDSYFLTYFSSAQTNIIERY